MSDEIHNIYVLVYRLLKVDFKTLQPLELQEILDYILGLPEVTLEHHKLRKRIMKVFGANLDLFPKDYHTALRDFLVTLTLIDARYDFYTFVKLTAETVIPNKFKDGRHIQVICEHLQSLYESYEDPDRKTERLQVFLPPRSMKSILCSVLFPAWILGRNPRYRVLLVGNSVQTAVDVFGRPLKNFIFSHEYQEIFPDTKIDPEAKSSQRFVTTAGGGFFCAGAKTGIAGKGGDFIICDDVLSEQNAFSKTERTTINNNYIPGIRSRAQPSAAELIVNTRWHLDDLSGFLLKVDAKSKRPWKIISIPAILDKPAAEVLKRKGDNENTFIEGGSYWPEYKPLEEILELKANYMITEPWKWYALYMQNPVPEEGNIVKHEDWQVWEHDTPPKVTQVIAVMDTAFGDTERADFSALTVWGVFNRRVETAMGVQYVPNMILLWAEKGKWDFHQLCDKCEWLRGDSGWKPDYFIIEKKASGIVLTQELHRRGFSLIEYDPRGKKGERLHAASMILKAKRVWLPVGKEWADEVRDEVCSFPSAPNDDLTDTVSMAVIWMRDNGVITYEAYEYEDEDDDGEFGRGQQGGVTYWSAAMKR